MISDRVDVICALVKRRNAEEHTSALPSRDSEEPLPLNPSKRRSQFVLTDARQTTDWTANWLH